MKKRAVFAAFLFSVLFASLCVRLGYIAFSENYAVADTYNSYSILLDTVEPNLYYSNYMRLTNNCYEKYALLKPNAKTLAELPKLFDNYDELSEELKFGKPLLVKTDIKETDYIPLYNIGVTRNNCRQLLSRDSSGLLSYLPEKVGERRLSFSVDALGRMLTGDEGKICDVNYITAEGLLLTLDEKVQNIAYDAAKAVSNGCIIIMNVETSSVLACVTKPDSSYVNKPFTLYPVGSVYKTFIAACAVENGINPEYECTGKIKTGDTEYSCQNSKKHGKQKLEDALCNSCNCYFVNLALQLGTDRILKTSRSFGFDENIIVYRNWNIKGSLLPEKDEMNGEGELPLIGFGQGKLMSTPLQICRALCAVADGGLLNDVKLVAAETDRHGNRKEISYNKPVRIMKEESSRLLLGYLKSVAEKGTGKNADYNNETAGKTATAQTGQYENGTEILNTWFAGVYPYSNPKYAIVIMKENGKSGAEDCCPVFRTIVEKLS